MKKKFMSFAPILLAVIMIAAVLSGCGKDDEKEEALANGVNTEEADEDADTEDTEEEEEIYEDEDEEYSEDDEDFDDGDIADDDEEVAEGDEEWIDYDDFVQEQSQKYDFKDYDDIIANLQSGQGYAYIRLQGLDEDILAVSDTVSSEGTASDASLYGMENGAPVFMSSVGGYGDDHPLRLDNGILYTGDEHSYETYFISKEYSSLMMKDSIEEDTESGQVEYFGFTRSENDFDNDKDFTGGEEEFKALISERDKKSVIKFTVK